MKYYVITPAKNEEHFIEHTIKSMIQQTLKPVKWIIVDDGSTDNTLGVIEKYKKEHDWIETISLNSKSQPKLYGSKVIKAFNEGYKLVSDKEFGFIVKMDADLKFPSNYFSEISLEFQKCSKLGICGGILVEDDEVNVKSVKAAIKRDKGFIRGCMKSIRKECFIDIEGFAEANGWDGLDQLKAKYLGWDFTNIPVIINHLRPTGTEYRSLQFYKNNGVAHYRMGNDIFLTIIRSIMQLNQKPYVYASVNYLKGYVKAFIKKEPKLVDKDLAKFIKMYHYKKMAKLFLTLSFVACSWTVSQGGGMIENGPLMGTNLEKIEGLFQPGTSIPKCNFQITK